MELQLKFFRTFYRIKYSFKQIYNLLFKSGSYKDERDSRRYKTIKIGKQIWMAENFDYKNDQFKSYKHEKYGRYYDWETANKIAPKGWHLPTDEDWIELHDYLGFDAAYKMTTMKGWASDYDGLSNSNSSGFNGLPGGCVDSNGKLNSNKYECIWWSSTETEPNSKHAWTRFIWHEYFDFKRTSFSKDSYFNVRLIKDKKANLVAKDINDSLINKDKVTIIENEPLIDVNGNAYKTIKIGKQIWMSKNLQVTNFQNGEPIPKAKNREEWELARKNQKPAWCIYNDYHEYKDIGLLYNWFAVNDSRGLAPEGWKIPTIKDWEIFIKYLRANNPKSKNVSFSICDEINKYGFSAVKGGYRQLFGGFNDIGSEGNWWSSTVNLENDGVFYMCLDYNDRIHLSLTTDKGSGLSIRCIR